MYLPIDAVGLRELEPVTEAPAETDDADAAAMLPGAKAVWLLGKRLAMQPCTQSLNCFAALAEPSPWSHLAAHLLVSIAWLALGRAIPWQAAWPRRWHTKSASFSH
jgi:hypothetical protein